MSIWAWHDAKSKRWNLAFGHLPVAAIAASQHSARSRDAVENSTISTLILASLVPSRISLCEVAVTIADSFARDSILYFLSQVSVIVIDFPGASSLTQGSRHWSTHYSLVKALTHTLSFHCSFAHVKDAKSYQASFRLVEVALPRMGCRKPSPCRDDRCQVSRLQTLLEGAPYFPATMQAFDPSIERWAGRYGSSRGR